PRGGPCPRGGLPQGDGAEAGGPLPVGPRPGRRRRTLARRRANHRAARAVDAALRPLGAATSHGGRFRRGRSSADDRGGGGWPVAVERRGATSERTCG